MDRQIITHLNTILKNELTAINQYFMHAKVMQYRGYDVLAAKTREESIDEMKHADTISDRILILGGLPNFQDLGKLMIGETVPEMLESDKKLEDKAIADLQEAIEYMEEKRDFVSADMLHEILISEEEHRDWLRKQLDLIEAMGLQNYLQKNA